MYINYLPSVTLIYFILVIQGSVINLKVSDEAALIDDKRGRNASIQEDPNEYRYHSENPDKGTGRLTFHGKSENVLIPAAGFSSNLSVVWYKGDYGNSFSSLHQRSDFAKGNGRLHSPNGRRVKRDITRVNITGIMFSTNFTDGCENVSSPGDGKYTIGDTF